MVWRCRLGYLEVPGHPARHDQTPPTGVVATRPGAYRDLPFSLPEKSSQRAGARWLSVLAMNLGRKSRLSLTPSRQHGHAEAPNEERRSTLQPRAATGRQRQRDSSRPVAPVIGVIRIRTLFFSEVVERSLQLLHPHIHRLGSRESCSGPRRVDSAKASPKETWCMRSAPSGAVTPRGTARDAIRRKRARVLCSQQALSSIEETASHDRHRVAPAGWPEWPNRLADFLLIEYSDPKVYPG